MRRQTVFLVVTAVTAMMASLIVYSALKQKDAEVQQARVTTVGIVVAAHDLKLGDKLDASALKFVAWPHDQTPPGSVTDPRAVIGSVVKAPFTTNEPIVGAKLFSGDKQSGLLPLLIPPQMRAMSVSVDEVADISGFVLPHSRVDVLAALSANGAEHAKIILQNVEVLAVAQDVEGKDKPQVEKVVTFLVTPEQAEQLTLASHEGVLRLALRSYGDDQIVATSGSDVESVMGAYNQKGSRHLLFAQSSRRNQAAEGEVVEIIRNGKKRQRLRFTADQVPAAPAEVGAADDSGQRLGMKAEPSGQATPPASAAVAQVSTAGASDDDERSDASDSLKRSDNSKQGSGSEPSSSAEEPSSPDTDAVAATPAGKTIDVP